MCLSEKVNHNESAWRQAKSQEERKRLSQQWIVELLAAVEAWSRNLEDGAFKNHSQDRPIKIKNLAVDQLFFFSFFSFFVWLLTL